MVISLQAPEAPTHAAVGLKSEWCHFPCTGQATPWDRYLTSRARGFMGEGESCTLYATNILSLASTPPPCAACIHYDDTLSNIPDRNSVGFIHHTSSAREAIDLLTDIPIR